MRLDVVIPAYNEARTVAAVVEACRASGAFQRVIVVDDGSSDDTAARARAAGAEVIRRTTNAGKLGVLGAVVAGSPGTWPDLQRS
jgi:glycosyltransferase involved in cell wall biosynthesis